jgi:LPS export ABC transporter protein LptC
MKKIKNEKREIGKRAARVGIVIWAAMVVAGCADLSQRPPGEPVPGELPEQELFTATMNFYQNDTLSGVLRAGRIRKFTKRSTVLLDSGVVMEFFNPEGQRTTVLTSDSGRADEVRRDMVAMGHVVARSDSGQQLVTEQLRWENRTRRIVSDQHVLLTTATDTISGIGFVSDEHLKNWEVMQPTGRSFREFQRRERRSYLSMPDTTVRSDSG